MLAFSGKGHFEIRAIDLNHVVQDLASLVSVSISKKVVLDYRLASPLPAIHADPAQIQQVVLNLLTNASDAIGDNAGTICLHTKHLELGQRFLDEACPRQDLQAGGYVELAVEDSGCGISREALPRIFDPFYTTKGPGRGLGLSAAIGILRGHAPASSSRANRARGPASASCSRWAPPNRPGPRPPPEPPPTCPEP